MSREQIIGPDELAQFIRKVDGDNRMGAGALAKAILDWLNVTPIGRSESLVSGEKLEVIESMVMNLDPVVESNVSNEDVLMLVNAVRSLQIRCHLLENS